MTRRIEEPSGIAEELALTHRIGTPLYCSECGYNLHQMPYIGQCPECGNAFNATALSMRGIFFFHTGYFPFGDLLAVLVSAGSAAALGVTALRPAPVNTTKGSTAVPTAPKPRTLGSWEVADPARLLIAAFFVVMTGVYAWRAYRQFMRFLRRLSISRRIAAED